MIRAITLAILAAAVSRAQTLPRFDVADVHVASQSSVHHPASSAIRGGRYEFRHATMVDLIAKAYDVAADKVVGGPRWLELNQFDVIAKFPDGSDTVTIRLMLRSLLADRFGMKIREESRPMPAWILTSEKKTQLKPTTESGAAQCKDETQEGAADTVPLVTVHCHNMTMAAFAKQLGGLQGAWYYVGDTPIVDRTELPGPWDFRFQYHRREKAIQPGAHIVKLSEGLSHIGLRLEAGEVPMPVMVVEAVNELPTANSPEAARVFPPVRLEFDVADLKPSGPDTRSADFQFLPGGLIRIRGWRLLGFLEEAWDLQSDDWVVGTAGFMRTDRWDLVAKAPPALSGATPGESVDEEMIDEMLKSLLVERFGLITHLETRTVPVWTLTSIKPKMQKSDPDVRSGCHEGAAISSAAASERDTRTVNPVLGRMLTCRNLPMKVFAERLQFYASGYIHSEVLDETGLSGGWDFTLSFSKLAQLTGANSSEPNGALSVQDAVEKQLGLKLQLQKRAVPVLVIDHMERKPKEN